MPRPSGVVFTWPTSETYVMDSDVGELVEDTDKLRNFVEDDFDFF